MPAPTMSAPTETDAQWMRRAIALAYRGQGSVEPNPMVGCVVVRDGHVLAEGWHRRFGGPHAERDAIAGAGEDTDLSGATWYVTLEPCCHSGKTPPCSTAVVGARPRRVVVAMRDPFPLVNGGGLAELASAGIEVEVGVCEDQARQLVAPFLKRLGTGRPWVIAKWAMTLDGKIATRTGDSRWISSPGSRRHVHAIRGRVDAIIVGAGTAVADDPDLTARPPGPRTAMRIVVDRHGTLPADSRLVRTAAESPVRVFADDAATVEWSDRLESAGVDVIRCGTGDRIQMIEQVLDHCGAAEMTNVLVEGGGTLLGALRDAEQIDEAVVFVSPKIIGGHSAVTPVAGWGLAAINQAHPWEVQTIERVEDDVMIIARKPAM